MQNTIIELAASQGIWASLSIVLIFYVLKAQERRDANQDTREDGYQKIILELTEHLEVNAMILTHIKEIESSLKRSRISGTE